MLIDSAWNINLRVCLRWCSQNQYRVGLSAPLAGKTGNQFPSSGIILGRDWHCYRPAQSDAGRFSFFSVFDFGQFFFGELRQAH